MINNAHNSLRPVAIPVVRMMRTFATVGFATTRTAQFSRHISTLSGSCSSQPFFKAFTFRSSSHAFSRRTSAISAFAMQFQQPLFKIVQSRSFSTTFPLMKTTPPSNISQPKNESDKKALDSIKLSISAWKSAQNEIAIKEREEKKKAAELLDISQLTPKNIYGFSQSDKKVLAQICFRRAKEEHRFKGFNEALAVKFAEIAYELDPTFQAAQDLEKGLLAENHKLLKSYEMQTTQSLDSIKASIIAWQSGQKAEAENESARKKEEAERKRAGQLLSTLDKLTESNLKHLSQLDKEILAQICFWKAKEAELGFKNFDIALRFAQKAYEIDLKFQEAEDYADGLLSENPCLMKTSPQSNPSQPKSEQNKKALGAINASIVAWKSAQIAYAEKESAMKKEESEKKRASQLLPNISQLTAENFNGLSQSNKKIFAQLCFWKANEIEYKSQNPDTALAIQYAQKAHELDPTLKEATNFINSLQAEICLLLVEATEDRRHYF